MKKLFIVFALAFIAAAFFLAPIALVGCTPAQLSDAKTITKTTLPILKEACVLANAAFPRSTVAKVCGLIGPELDIADKLISSQKSAGAARSRPYPVTCEETDAGVRCEKPFIVGVAGTP